MRGPGMGPWLQRSVEKASGTRIRLLLASGYEALSLQLSRLSLQVGL